MRIPCLRSNVRRKKKKSNKVKQKNEITKKDKRKNDSQEKAASGLAVLESGMAALASKSGGASLAPAGGG